MKKTVFLFISLTCLGLLLIGCQTEGKTEEKKEESMKLEYEGIGYEVPEEYRTWNLSSKFQYQTSSSDGNVLEYAILGEKDGFGITGSFPLKAKQGNKYMWFYFGEKDIKNKSVKVMTYKKGTEELIYLHHGEFKEESQVNENEVNMPSNLMFPSSGVWNVLIFIEDEPFGNIVVEVIPKAEN